MRRIRAIANQTFHQCLRMKVAVAFMVLLAAVLAILPFVMEGDGTLSGQVRTFLNYSVSATAGVLIVVTVFLTVGIIAADIQERRIFTLAVKPIGRWQYVLGRWLGVVFFDTLLLAVAGLAMFAFVHHLGAGKAQTLSDRRALETEVFTARRKVSPQPLELSRDVAERIAELKKEKTYQDAIKTFLPQANGDPDVAARLLTEEISKQVAASKQSTGPTGSLSWRFEGLAEGETRRTKTTVELTGPHPDGGGQLLRLPVSEDILGRMMAGGPVEVGGITGKVFAIGGESVDVLLPGEAYETNRLLLQPGKEVELVVPDTIQITFKPSAAGAAHDQQLNSLWAAGSPGRYSEVQPHRCPFRLPSTLTFSTRTIGPDGDLVVQFQNQPDPITGRAVSVEILHEDISVRYRVGDFSPNYLRGMVLILIQLMFIAAIGAVMGSFLSFPVGSLACFGMLPFGLARRWLDEAVHMPAGTEYDNPFIALGRIIFAIMTLLLPDLESTSPAGALTDGTYIAWGMGLPDETAVLGALGPMAARIVVSLAIACLIFSRRELARVQV